MVAIMVTAYSAHTIITGSGTLIIILIATIMVPHIMAVVTILVAMLLSLRIPEEALHLPPVRLRLMPAAIAAILVQAALQ